MASVQNEPHYDNEIIRITDENQNIIEGNLTVPSHANTDAKGIVIFAHGSGSSRHSPRNRYVAQVLNNAGIAIISRGGRPDLASSDVLSRIEAPTLLIVGEKDKQVIELNEKALGQLIKIEKKKKIIIIPKATHLFEEPGTLEEVARVASGWFQCFFLEERE
jgi:predicted alpha/beta-hydrolase family hydrolase